VPGLAFEGNLIRSSGASPIFYLKAFLVGSPISASPPRPQTKSIIRTGDSSPPTSPSFHSFFMYLKSFNPPLFFGLFFSFPRRRTFPSQIAFISFLLRRFVVSIRCFGVLPLSSSRNSAPRDNPGVSLPPFYPALFQLMLKPRNVRRGRKSRALGCLLCVLQDSYWS